MSDLITINDTQIAQLTYHDEPVVTFEMIAKVHGVPVSNVQKSFQRHQERFTEGKHYDRIDAIESERSGLRVQTGQHGAILFTEKGYLLLVKPMKDEQSWQVQERMVDDYFTMKQTLRALPAPPPLTIPTAEDRLHVLKACTMALEDLGVLDDRDKIEFGAYIRQVARTEMQPLLGPGAFSSTASSEPSVWTLSMRLQALGYPPLHGPESTSIQIKLGGAAKKAYSQMYGEDPKKLWDYVKGQMRLVNGYPAERVGVLDETIAVYLGEQGSFALVPHPHAQEEQ